MGRVDGRERESGRREFVGKMDGERAVWRDREKRGRV